MKRETINMTSKGVRLLKRFATEADLYAFKGAMHPDDYEQIEDDYVKAYANLARYISQLEGQTQ